MTKLLICIPTYNEYENVQRLYQQIIALALQCDLLFIDDHSPDGTGKLLDNLAQQNPQMTVLHRAGKQGIGSAHLTALRYAYTQQYDCLITMDADFTHRPQDILALLDAKQQGDVIIGSRHLQKHSLREWPVTRRMLSSFNHFLIKYLLGIHQDASSAFRLYHLKLIPADCFQEMISSSYSFFFESLYRLKSKGYQLSEIPIPFPARNAGKSKLTLRETFLSAYVLLKLLTKNLRR